MANTYKIPVEFKFLQEEGAPKMLVESLKLLGLTEIKGKVHNPAILAMAKELGIDNIYKADETPWCGLDIGVVALRAGKNIPLKGYDILRAREWRRFGTQVLTAMLGDVLVFERDGGGHVGLYVGEDKFNYFVLGGNQGDRHSIVPIAKDRCIAIRRPIYASGQPKNVRQIFIGGYKGPVSKNES